MFSWLCLCTHSTWFRSGKDEFEWSPASGVKVLHFTCPSDLLWQPPVIMWLTTEPTTPSADEDYAAVSSGESGRLESIITLHFNKLQLSSCTLSTYTEKGFENRLMSFSMAAQSLKRRFNSVISDVSSVTYFPIFTEMSAFGELAIIPCRVGMCAQLRSLKCLSHKVIFSMYAFVPHVQMASEIN